MPSYFAGRIYYVWTIDENSNITYHDAPQFVNPRSEIRLSDFKVTQPEKTSKDKHIEAF